MSKYDESYEFRKELKKQEEVNCRLEVELQKIQEKKKKDSYKASSSDDIGYKSRKNDDSGSFSLLSFFSPSSPINFLD